LAIGGYLIVFSFLLPTLQSSVQVIACALRPADDTSYLLSKIISTTDSYDITLSKTTTMTRHQAIRQGWERTLRASRIETFTDDKGELVGMKFLYDIRGKRIAVIMSYDASAEYEQRHTSVPAQYLDRNDEAGWWSDGAENSDNAEKRMYALQDEMVEAIHNACHHKLMELVGPPPPVLPPGRNPLSEGRSSEQENAHFPPPPQNLHEYMYPESLAVQLVSKKFSSN
jgi:hypothetical protein